MEAKKILVTHNSTFHADDVFATAILKLRFGNNVTIIRSRDASTIEKADVVYDVGGIYDPEKDRFDHHQPERAGNRPNSIPYASFGLVWKKYGPDICGSLEVADALDAYLVQAIDAPDNGVDLFTLTRDIVPYLFSAGLYTFRPTWKEDSNYVDEGFFEAVAIAEKILARAIIQARDRVEGERAVIDAYNKAEDKRVLILDDRYPWEEVALTFPEALFVIAPRMNDGQWKAEGVRVKKGSMECKIYFPETWAGKYHQELADVTGIQGSVFCHLGRFMVTAKTKEDVLALVKMTLGD
ncbi:MAG: MYG1 family protein [Candidatus Pacebacteria bacterium]|jgi:uncharacterized UPF0160 family protein|nr:MYG1 family protein [Candidatus Paceibacterota bacterium]